MMIKNITKISISITAIYLLTLLISINTPMQSDDYRYFMTGISIESHYNHYMEWSGRVVADYISTLILSSENHTLISVINSLGIVLLSTFIVMIPGKKTSNGFCISVVTIFLLYWISNPNLGQTTFWVVGAANYLWTNVFITAYFVFLFKVLSTNSDVKLTILFTLSIFAGCSNENTSITTTLATLSVCVFYYIRNKKLSYKIIIALFGNIIGALILLLSPGNFARASNPAFDSWNDLSLIAKIYYHIIDRMPLSFTLLWPAIIALSISLFICAMINRGKSNNIVFSLLFFSLYVTSNIILIGAPWLPPRAFNGGLIFLLISISFILKEIESSRMTFTISTIAFMAMIFFAPSYYFMYNAYHRTMIQQELRLESIKLDKNNGLKITSIPDFWFTKLVKVGDKFDKYHSSVVIGKYFGMDDIKLDKAQFDYSGIKSKDVINVDYGKENKLNLSKIYMHYGSPLTPDQLILEFTDFPSNIDNLYIHAETSNGGIEIKKPKGVIKLSGKYYTAFDAGKIKINTIKKISLKRSDGNNDLLIKDIILK